MLALVLAVTLAPTPAPAAPPDGTYTYVEMENGKRIASYVVAVKRAGPRIALEGNLEPMAGGGDRPIVESRETIDASTLDLLTYNEMEEVGCSAIPHDVTVSGSNAHLGDKTVHFPGIEHYVLDDASSVPLFLPAEVAVWNDGRAVSIEPENGVARVIEPYPVALQPQRPSSVPAGDRYIALHELGEKSGTSGLWYDPQTLVVDEVDTQSTQWLRKERL